MTRFQIYPETELASNYKTPFYKTQYSKTLAECEKGFNMNTGKLIISPNATHYISNHDENSYIPVTFLKNSGNVGGKLRPQDKSKTRLPELSLMNNNYCGAIHFDIHLDMKLDNTAEFFKKFNFSSRIFQAELISRIFQETSLSELETLHHLCELERTQN